MKLIYIFVFIFLYKLVSNIILLFQSKLLLEKYKEWIKNSNDKFPTYKREIINLFKKANIKDVGIASAEPVGFGYISTHTASIFLNFPSRYKSHVGAAISMFNEAIGVYKLRIKQCFNPIYWIDQVIFLPKNILLYLNLDSNKNSFKISNLLLSFIWWITIFLFGIFKDRFKTIIITIIENLI